MLKEVVAANVKALFCYLPGMANEKTKKLIWDRVLH
jgi:hypothetical protein